MVYLSIYITKNIHNLNIYILYNYIIEICINLFSLKIFIRIYNIF